MPIASSRRSTYATYKNKMSRISRLLLQASQLPSCIVTRMAKPVVQKSSMSSDPFANLKISSHEPLKSVEGQGRSPCPMCDRKRKFYCHNCYCLVGLNPSSVPVVNLPINVDILKHPKEEDTKTTGVHASILAPHQVTTHVYPDIPTYTDTSRALLLYPKDEALSTHEAAEMIKESSRVSGASSPNPWGSFDRLVVIDSPPKRLKTFLNDERVKELPSVKLTEAKTIFWSRQNTYDSKNLDTIEAIYYFFREMSELVEGHTYDGLYDNLLFFFAYQYSLVKQSQQERSK